MDSNCVGRGRDGAEILSPCRPLARSTSEVSTVHSAVEITTVNHSHTSQCHCHRHAVSHLNQFVGSQIRPHET